MEGADWERQVCLGRVCVCVCVCVCVMLVLRKVKTQNNAIADMHGVWLCVCTCRPLTCMIYNLCVCTDR